MATKKELQERLRQRAARALPHLPPNVSLLAQSEIFEKEDNTVIDSRTEKENAAFLVAEDYLQKIQFDGRQCGSVTPKELEAVAKLNKVSGKLLKKMFRKITK